MNLWIIVVTFLKTDLTAIIHTGIFNNLPEGKLSSASNLIFIKSFSCLVGMLPLIISI